MIHHQHGIFVRALAVGAISLVAAGSVHAAAGTLKYENAADRYTVSYPATWKCSSEPTANASDTLVASLSPVAFGCISPDHHAAFLLLVGHRRTSSALLKTNVLALLHDDDTVMGSVTYGARTIHGVRYLQAAARAQIAPQLLSEQTVLGTSRARSTYYAAAVQAVTPVTASSRDRADLTAIVASLELT
jgi:hypothetical protein